MIKNGRILAQISQIVNHHAYWAQDEGGRLSEFQMWHTNRPMLIECNYKFPVEKKPIMSSIQCMQGIVYLKEGATKEDAALWRTLIPINRMKASLSCSKTYFTVVPKNNSFNQGIQYLL